MDILTTITEYKNHLKAEGYAPATMDSYRKGLDQFCRYLAGRDIRDPRNGYPCDDRAIIKPRSWPSPSPPRARP